MKIAIVMPLAEQRGGAELMLLHLLRANKAGPNVDYQVVFLEAGTMVAAVQALGYPVSVFPAGQLRQVGRFAATVYALKNWMQHLNIQIAMSWMSKAHLYAGPAAFAAGIPSVWWQHGVSGGHWLDRWATATPAQMIFCCSKTAEQAQKQLLPRRKTSVIYPAVDLSRLAPDVLPSVTQARQEIGLPAGRPVIGIVSRLQHSKGVHVFLEAAAQVARSHPDAQFVVVGGTHALEPDYADALTAQVGRLNIGGSVLFAGYQENSLLWMQAMDIVVLASIAPEGFGMVIIEAQGLGKTVIATRSGGPSEVVEDGVDGFLTTPNDASGLAEALLKALPALHQPGPASAARRKAASFGTERLAEDMARNLQRLTV